MPLEDRIPRWVLEIKLSKRVTRRTDGKGITEQSLHHTNQRDEAETDVIRMDRYAFGGLYQCT